MGLNKGIQVLFVIIVFFLLREGFFNKDNFPLFYVFFFSAIVFLFFILNLNNLCIKIRNFFKKNKKQKSIHQNNYNSDTSINKKEDDKLGLDEDIQKLKDILFSGIKSVLINGKWGDGKTSLYNLVKIEGDFLEHFEVLEFNPWKLSIDKNIISAFLEQLVSRFQLLENTGKSLEKLLVSNEKSFGIVDFIFGIGNIEEYKKYFNEYFFNKKLLIIIDDLDRLSDKKQIFEVLKLVGEFQDCENIQFLFLFDKECIEKILENTEKGYLDKIINFVYSLNISTEKLKEYLNSEIKLELDEEKYLLYKLEDGLWRYNLKNFRSTKLLLNKFNDRNKVLNFEVNNNQLFQLTILEIFYPLIYRYIFENKGLLISNYSHWGRSLNDGSKKTSRIIKTTLENLLLNFTELEKEYILTTILKNLFPNIDIAFGGNPGHKSGDSYMKEQNIDHPNYFEKYFLQKIPTNISDIHLIEKLMNFHSSSEKEIEEFIISEYKQNQLSRMKGFVKKIKKENIEDSIFLLIGFINSKTDFEKDYLFFSRISGLIQSMIDERFHHQNYEYDIVIQEETEKYIEAEKMKFYEEIIIIAKNNLFISIFISYYYDKKGFDGWSEKDYKGFYKEISEYFIKKIKEIKTSEDLYFGLEGEEKNQLFFTDVGLTRFLKEDERELVRLKAL